MGKGHRIEGMVDGPTHRHTEGGLSVVLRGIPGVTERGLLRSAYQFQVAPLDEFGVDSSYNWVDYDTISKGQFTRDGGRTLRTTSLRSLVVDYNPSWALIHGGKHHRPQREPGGTAPNPRAVADELHRLARSGSPMQLRVWNRALHARPELDMPVTIRSLSVRERAGEPDARYFDISFTEWRDPDIRRKKAGKGKGNREHDLPAVVRVNRRGIAEEVEAKRENIPERKRHHIGTAEKPATLRKLAKHYYGKQSSRYWKLIAAKNGLTNVAGETPLSEIVKRGRPHRKLTIPKPPQAWWETLEEPEL